MNQKTEIAIDRKNMLRWGNGMRADSDFAREQILSAALDCYKKYTLEGTCMKNIAREAKVTRATIYRHFENRNDVVLGVILRELHGILDVIQEQISKESSFAEFIVETLAVANEKIRFSPIFELIVNESAMLMERIHGYGTQLLAISGVYFRARFDVAKAAGELRSGVEYDDFMNWVYHIGASFILIPSDAQSTAELRSMLWRYLIPAIVRTEAIAENGRY